jgi:hypothetical protein
MTSPPPPEPASARRRGGLWRVVVAGLLAAASLAGLVVAFPPGPELVEPLLAAIGLASHEPQPTAAASLPPAAAGYPASPPAASGAPAGDTATMVRGIPLIVVNTGTLLLGSRLVHLEGVTGEEGEFARQMAHYIGGREIVCEPTDRAGLRYRCRIEDYDLAEAVLLNGGGRASPAASARLRAAEEKARAAGRGIWQHAAER